MQDIKKSVPKKPMDTFRYKSLSNDNVIQNTNQKVLVKTNLLVGLQLIYQTKEKKRPFLLFMERTKELLVSPK